VVELVETSRTVYWGREISAGSIRAARDLDRRDPR
jgi:hypothetical protein